MNKHLQSDWSSAGFSLRITDLENTETLKLENIEGNIQEKFMKPAEQQLESRDWYEKMNFSFQSRHLQDLIFCVFSVTHLELLN